MKNHMRRVLQKLNGSRKTRVEKLRALNLEALEGRRLLAGDVVELPFHNKLISTDVNEDFTVTPLDALVVINELNQQGSRSLMGEEPDPLRKAYFDVSGDGNLSAIDALQVINDLNAEGEDGPLVTFSTRFTNLAGEPIDQIVVGQTFRYEVLVQDSRGDDATGIAQAAIDVGITNFNNIEYPISGGFFQSINFGEIFGDAQRGFRGDAGQEQEEFFNEVSAFNQSRPPAAEASDVELFFSVEIEATSAGNVTFSPNEHEQEPESLILVHGTDTAIPTSMVEYGPARSLSIIVDPTSPVANNDTVTTPEDTDLILAGPGANVDPLLTANDTFEDGRSISVVSIDTIDGSTQGTIDGFTYSPPENFFGTDTLTYTIEDTAGLRASATITINVQAVNDAPTAADDSFSVDEDTVDNSLLVLANDDAGPNEPGDTLTVTAVGEPSNGGTVAITNAGDAVLYTPATGFIGTDSFTYTITDGGGATDQATVTVMVEPGVIPSARFDSNTPPSDAIPAIAEDTEDIVLDVLANDRVNEGASAILLGIETQPDNGSVSIDDNGTPDDQTDDTILYTPDPDFFGADSFTYRMNDTSGTGDDAIGTIALTIDDVNDTPVLADDTASATEDMTLTIPAANLLANDSPGPNEAATQSLEVTSVSAVGAGGTVMVNGNDVVYTPAADFNGEFVFTYNATDNGTNPNSLSATATVTVTVSAVNDDPIAVDDSGFSVNEDNQLSIETSDLLDNDLPGPETATDESSQTISVVSVSATSAEGGQVDLSGTTLSYQPATNFFGQDTFTYTIQDELGASASATVTVSVNAINDAPIANPDSLTAFTDIPLVIEPADLLGNDSPGPDNESQQSLSLAGIVEGSEIGGEAVLNQDGTITFTPDAGFTGAGEFQYRLQDSGSGAGDNQNTSVGTVTIDVQEFVPSTISGTLFVDETNDGVIDDAERRVGGVSVTLSGVSLGEPIEPQTHLTLADGSYHFEGLGPGQYVVSYAKPALMLDGRDIPNPTIGDMDSVENQFTIEIETPGGVQANNFNFAMLGVEPGRARIIDQLASRYMFGNPELRYEGMFLGVGSGNAQLWGAKLDGFDNVEFAEAVFSSNGAELLLTIVDTNQVVRTASLEIGEFVATPDVHGNQLVRVLGGEDRFDWQVVDLSTPPIYSANRYLDAVDAIFDQEEW